MADFFPIIFIYFFSFPGGGGIGGGGGAGFDLGLWILRWRFLGLFFGLETGDFGAFSLGLGGALREAMSGAGSELKGRRGGGGLEIRFLKWGGVHGRA